MIWLYERRNVTVNSSSHCVSNWCGILYKLTSITQHIFVCFISLFFSSFTSCVTPCYSLPSDRVTQETIHLTKGKDAQPLIDVQEKPLEVTWHWIVNYENGIMRFCWNLRCREKWVKSVLPWLYFFFHYGLVVAMNLCPVIRAVAAISCIQVRATLWI